MHEILTAHCREAATLVARVETYLPTIEAIAEEIVNCLRNGGKLLTCGNGGSAAEAQHFAEELVGRYKRERRSLPAVSLVADGTLLTCIVNDYGADEIFARQVDGLGCSGDVLVGLSTSGNSENVRRAMERARARGLKTVALLGRDGGLTAGLADYEIIVESGTSARIQEVHLLFIHLFCEAIDEAFA
ncbi:MAG: SIS domain-containing protein [Abitibacteriaceae bacterium]|nr:SIS domain-containing protein [Abditibacteriaceae bacterium]